MASRVSALIRSVSDPDTPALGVWTRGQLAAHLTHVYEVDLDLLNEVPSPLADLDQRADERAHHLLDEGVGARPDPQERAIAAAVELVQCALGRTVVVGTAPERGEVVRAEQVTRRFVHGVDIKGSWMMQRRAREKGIVDLALHERVDVQP